MSGFLLDTNCISELVRAKPEPRVLEWMDAVDESLLFLSVLTLGEIRKASQGYRRADGARVWSPGWNWSYEAASLGGFFPLTARSPTVGDWSPPRPSPRAAPSRPSMVCWRPRLFRHNLTIVSRNVADFGNTPAPILNPWEA